MARVAGAGDSIEYRVERLERHRGALGQARMPARRRLDAFGDPAIQVDETRAQERRVVDRVPQVLRVFGRLRRIGGGRFLGRGRPHAETMLGAREVIDAHARTVLDVARPAGIGVDQRCIAAVVLRGGVGVHHLEAGRRLDLERLEVGHRPGPVLAVLAEALVELAAHAAGDVGDDAIERLVVLLVLIQAVVNERAQQASRLRAPVRVRPAHAHRRLAVLQPRGAVAQRDEAEADHLRTGGRVGEVIEPAPGEAAVQGDVARIGRDAAVVHARELPRRARDDFRLGVTDHVVWVRNAPSPAATSSLAIAEELVGRLVD